MGDTLPEKAGGLPANAPARPADALPVPNVYAVRPTREAPPLDADGQKKLESDLTSLRESQKARANPPPRNNLVFRPQNKNCRAPLRG